MFLNPLRVRRIKFGKRINIILSAVFAVIILAVVYLFFLPNTRFREEKVYVTIPTNSSYGSVMKILSKYVDNMNEFELVARINNYDSSIKAGRFLLKRGMGNLSILKSIHRNVPVQLTFNNQERLENLASRISAQIEPDSTRLMETFKDSVFLDKYGFNEENILTLFIPNTYQFFWNISAEGFRNKMLDEYSTFWNAERRKKAEEQGLTPIEVIILASIVHKESVKRDERPTIAGVYLNRLRLRMPLQADPTVIFAVKRESNDYNQVIKRVYYGNLSISSAYNTYKNTGLPPGPICMPDISAIEAVLNPEKHNYIYFCASVDRPGYHEYASNIQEHSRNAVKYKRRINKMGIK